MQIRQGQTRWKGKKAMQTGGDFLPDQTREQATSRQAERYHAKWIRDTRTGLGKDATQQEQAEALPCEQEHGQDQRRQQHPTGATSRATTGHRRQGVGGAEKVHGNQRKTAPVLFFVQISLYRIE